MSALSVDSQESLTSFCLCVRTKQVPSYAFLDSPQSDAGKSPSKPKSRRPARKDDSESEYEEDDDSAPLTAVAAKTKRSRQTKKKQSSPKPKATVDAAANASDDSEEEEAFEF